jgi:hypothetical protein
MNWTTPQVITAVGSLICGFVLVFLDFFLTETHIIHDSTLYVLGQSFLYAGGIFGVKGYIDNKLINYRNNYRKNGNTSSRQSDRKGDFEGPRVHEE